MNQHGHLGNLLRVKNVPTFGAAGNPFPFANLTALIETGSATSVDKSEKQKKYEVVTKPQKVVTSVDVAKPNHHVCTFRVTKGKVSLQSVQKGDICSAVSFLLPRKKKKWPLFLRTDFQVRLSA